MPAETPKAAPMGPLCCANGVSRVLSSVEIVLFQPESLEALHSEESGGSHVAELGLGNGVAVRARLVSVSLHLRGCWDVAAVISLGFDSVVAYLGPYWLLKVS